MEDCAGCLISYRYNNTKLGEGVHSTFIQLNGYYGATIPLQRSLCYLEQTI